MSVHFANWVNNPLSHTVSSCVSDPTLAPFKVAHFTRGLLPEDHPEVAPRGNDGSGIASGARRLKTLPNWIPMDSRQCAIRLVDPVTNHIQRSRKSVCYLCIHSNKPQQLRNQRNLLRKKFMTPGDDRVHGYNYSGSKIIVVDSWWTENGDRFLQLR
ncbi:hypothetical protein T265_12328 [Opisthorchis viverrini]|uniref:Uncharacterized protein n=1 Tax=Opisthorchis viverrini TaxID=6198 RepID=A0A074YTY8_OPIVI|nr:hypothetical protein T265_12328 [Opisthorchis viverrini]KER18261.1 hypothetical protein T265_12328 [Opisthorchis viverrini]